MVLKKARKLPRKYNRPVSDKTRSLAQKRRTRRKKLQQDKFKRSLKRIQRRLTIPRELLVRWLLIIMAASLLAGFGFLLFSPAVRIRTIQASSTDPRLDRSQVQLALAPLFGRHTFFLSHFEVRSLLTNAFSDVRSIEVTKLYPDTLSVAIELDPLVAKLDIVQPGQELTPTSATGAVIDYLTEEGVFIQTDAAIEASHLKTIRIVDWGAKPQPGNTVMNAEMIERLQVAEDILQSQFGHTVRVRSVYMRAQEFHLLVENYSLWFDMRSPIDQHIQRYKTFLDAVGKESASEYVDLRLTDQVVYK